MRTTLDIDDDVLAAAKELARQERKSTGEVVSELARRALIGTAGASEGESFLGFRPFARQPGKQVVTNQLIDKLRGEGPY